MNQEFNALQRSKTWTLVPPSPSYYLVGTKWLYNIKRDTDVQVQRYKACLVAKGYLQQSSLDYGETFNPVIKLSFIRVVLTIVVTRNCPLKQLGVSNTVLHDTLTEDVFITQPQGYVDSSHPHYVCKLHKTLYGLKQAPQAWYDALCIALIRWNFCPSQADSSILFITHIMVQFSY